MNIGERIKTLRESKGMSQVELAEKLKLSRSSVSMYESGNRVPSTYVLQDMSDLFNIDIDYILGKTDKTTVLPERIANENKFILFKSEDFTLSSPTRELKDSYKSIIQDQLTLMTYPIEEKPPTREYMITWLRENWHYAAEDGFIYEDMNDEELYEFYIDAKQTLEEE